MKKIERFIRDHESLMRIVSLIYRLFMRNRVRGRKYLTLSNGGTFLRGCKILNYGKNNLVEIGAGCRMRGCTIRIYGDGNSIKISKDCKFNNLDIWCSDGSNLLIGHNTHITGQTHIAVIEGTTVTVGERCLFASDITLRTGDSHSILDLDGKRINASQDIVIGKHVWIGEKVIVLKGAAIGAETIVGAGAIVTGKEYGKNVVLAGTPAREVKKDVTWWHELL